MYTALLIFQVLLCVALVALVLIQKGQGADIGAVFGGGASQTVFGAAGAGNFLSHATAVLAALFFLNSLALAYLSDHVAHSAATGISLPASAPVATTESHVPAPVVPARSAVAPQGTSGAAQTTAPLHSVSKP
ncbi:MAG: preprotein translocase subunit SecG [Acidithiobacillus sp.]|nr:preprotein translocase subunit SecG [Acidithiobacillus sp.]